MASTLTRRLALLAIAMLLVACAGLTGRIENPRVTVTSTRLRPKRVVVVSRA